MKFWVVYGVLTKQNGFDRNIQAFAMSGYAEQKESAIGLVLQAIMADYPGYNVGGIWAQDQTVHVYEFAAKFPEGE